MVHFNNFHLGTRSFTEGIIKGHRETVIFYRGSLLKRPYLRDMTVIGGSGTDCLMLVREMSRKQASPPSFIFSKWKGQKHRKIP